MLKRYIKLIPFCSKNTFNVFNGHVILYRIHINISIYLFISISVSKKIYLGRNRQAVRLAITATKKKNNYCNNIDVKSISNKVNSNSKMTNPTYNYNKWDPLNKNETCSKMIT